MKCVDPSSMSHDERLAELGELLAAAVRRFLARECKVLANQRDPLDVVADVEAPCGRAVESAP